MKRNQAYKLKARVLLAAVGGLFFLSSISQGRVNPKGCSKAPELSQIESCSKAQGDDEAKCATCQQTIQHFSESSSYRIARDQAKSCEELGDCGVSEMRANRGAARDAEADARDIARAGGQCNMLKSSYNDTVKGAATECLDHLKACSSGLGARNKEIANRNRESCQQAKRDATDTGNDQKKKGDENNKNGKKGDENANKGGSMPQIPQIPQMPQNKDDNKPPEQPPVAEKQEHPTDTKHETEVAKIGDSTKSPQVGFGGSTDTHTSTIAPPPGGFGGGAALAPISTSAPSNNNEHNAGPVNNTGSSSPGGGGGAGLSGSGGPAAPAAEGKSESAQNNGYEVQPGGGGKLGAPKGFKSGGEPDAVVAEAAKESFKNDLGVDPGRNVAGDPKAEEPSEDGYTIFKMVKYRYSELKKKGNI